MLVQMAASAPGFAGARVDVRRSAARRRASLCAARHVVVRQALAQHVGQRAQDRPVFAGVARRERGALGLLDAAFGVHVGAVLFGVGGAGQDDVGAVRAGVAVACLGRRRRPCRVSWCRFRRRRAGRRSRCRRARRRRGSRRVLPPFCGRKPRSSAPTRPAAVCRTLKPFQPPSPAGPIMPVLRAICAAAARIAAPSARASAPWPTISIGCLAFFSASKAPCLPAAMSVRSAGLLSRSWT